MTLRLLLCGASACAVLLASTASGQVQVQSGHALDANLRLGSAGYNGNVSRGGPVSYSNFTSRYGAYNQYAPRSNMRGQYNPYVGGYGQGVSDRRMTNFDTYLTDRSYSAGWQRTNGGYSSYSGPPRGSGGGNAGASAGAYKINTKITG